MLPLQTACCRKSNRASEDASTLKNFVDRGKACTGLKVRPL
jgi:hypothetical protein